MQLALALLLQISFYPPSGPLPPLPVLAIGDSKTSVNIAHPLLETVAASHDPLHPLSRTVYWNTSMGFIAVSGHTAALMAANIDTYLAATTGTPWAITINLGVNDCPVLPVEATWKTDFGYFLDALHTKWSNARIFTMEVWQRGQDANCDTVNTWMATVRSMRPWVAVGPDERVFLKGADNGVTYTADGLHPNAAGYLLTAQKWADVLGH